MAKATMKMPDDFLMKISQLGDKTDTIVSKMLEEGAEVIERKTKANLASVIGKNTKEDARSTGELISALGATPVKQGKDGNHNIKIGFSEIRTDGVSNAMLANILEYGKSGQPAKPFLKPAVSSTKRQVVETMMTKFDKEVSDL